MGNEKKNKHHRRREGEVKMKEGTKRKMKLPGFKCLSPPLLRLKKKWRWKATKIWRIMTTGSVIAFSFWINECSTSDYEEIVLFIFRRFSFLYLSFFFSFLFFSFQHLLWQLSDGKYEKYNGWHSHLLPDRARDRQSKSSNIKCWFSRRGKILLYSWVKIFLIPICSNFSFRCPLW